VHSSACGEFTLHYTICHAHLVSNLWAVSMNCGQSVELGLWGYDGQARARDDRRLASASLKAGGRVGSSVCSC
jgi:hypothetical protein